MSGFKPGSTLAPTAGAMTPDNKPAAPGRFVIGLGAMQPLPSLQVKQQGFALRQADLHDNNARALERLRIHGVLTQTEAKRAASRLIHQIAQDVTMSETEAP